MSQRRGRRRRPTTDAHDHAGMRRGQSYQRATEPENDPSLCVQTFRVGALGEPLLADERGDERKSGKWIGMRRTAGRYVLLPTLRSGN